MTDREITRLATSAFPLLPENLAQDLLRRGCTIPQPVFARQPQNAIKGQFARPGQVDWAVLCSVKGRSSILVFWNGSDINPASIAPVSDDHFIQGIGQGKFGFSRAIAAVGRSYIPAHAAVSGPKGSNAPVIDHQGIDDAFVERGPWSTIRSRLKSQSASGSPPNCQETTRPSLHLLSFSVR